MPRLAASARAARIVVANTAPAIDVISVRRPNRPCGIGM
jgi:hypothetical protein